MMVCSLLVGYQHIGGTAVFIFWVEGLTLKMEGTGFSELLVTEMHICWRNTGLSYNVILAVL